MTLRSRIVASGPGWFLQDVVCGAGPGDRPFEERHGSYCLAAVISGTFAYQSSQGRALLVPGAVMLGNAGACFECNHEHAVGDRCLSFHFSPDYWEQVVAGVPGARHMELRVPRLPPRASMIAVTAALEAAREGSAAAMEEGALQFAGAVVAALHANPGEAGSGSWRRARDVARVTRVVRHIETAAHQAPDVELSVRALAGRAGMSPYHFLRTFRSIAGMTPHQFVLRTRLNRAAVCLRTTCENISEVALDAGFSDLSSFNRRFRQVMGVSPRAYRTAGCNADRRACSTMVP